MMKKQQMCLYTIEPKLILRESAIAVDAQADFDMEKVFSSSAHKS